MKKEIILISLFAFLLSITLAHASTPPEISGEEAGQMLSNFLNKKVGGGVEYLSYEDFGFLYKITVSYKEKEIPVFITRDGKYFISGITPIDYEEEPKCIEDKDCEQGYICEDEFCIKDNSVPKSDKPEVDLFVFTKCPYGVQAERGLLPVIELLKNKINWNIYYIDYFMHGEEEERETYRQLCIREEQPLKFLQYIKCYKDKGNGEKCITKVFINQKKLKECINLRAKDYFTKDSNLSKAYEVTGSPTLIINKKLVFPENRSPQEYLNVICSSFNNPPKECLRKISKEVPNAGF